MLPWRRITEGEPERHENEPLVRPARPPMSLLDRIDKSLLQGALQIAQRLVEHGFQAYFAGGAVRDLLLQRKVADIDIATSAPPDAVENLFQRTTPVGREFGVIVVPRRGIRYEVATFRMEGIYEDGRHPSSVRFSDLREDAQRRDFTVNALFLDPFREEVIDYIGGQNDLTTGLIRTVGSAAQRFREDKLRILRAVRFACQLGFRIEQNTWRQVRDLSRLLTQVSWERIRDEILKILTGSAPERGLALLLDTGILDVILPEIAAMKGVPQPPQFHPEGDVFTHTTLMFALAQEVTETLALAVLLHDVGKPPTFSVQDRIRFNRHAEVGADMAEKICRRLRISKGRTEQVVDLVRHHLRFMHVREMRKSKLKRFLRKEKFGEHLELHRLDCLASHRDLSNYEFCRQQLDRLSQEAMRPRPFINGYDLIEAGFKSGPIFSEILEKVEDLQLEGKVGSKVEALQWVRRNYSVSEAQT